MSQAQRRILCVDDDPRLLDGLRRQLRRGFDVYTEPGGEEGLRAAREADASGGFDVVLSDLRMPGMNGIEFLTRLREIAPDSTRVLLTGDADLTSALAAVNEGNIFRFLTKPCPPETLVPALNAAAEHHRLVTAERELLEKTLHGCVKMLTEVLALANPSGFGRATRVKELAGSLASHLGSPQRWKIEMAAMLSQVASITLPVETLERACSGDTLGVSEQSMVDRLPEVAEKLLADIPRLEDVRAILRNQSALCDDKSDTAASAEVQGARILKVALDLDAAQAKGLDARQALERLRSGEVWYAPDVLDAVAVVADLKHEIEEIRDVTMKDLHSGMILQQPVESLDGRLLVAHGQEVSLSVLERLRNFSSNIGVKEPVRVLVRTVA